MGTPAADIDDAINFCDNNVAEVAYGAPPPATESLLTQMNLWIAGMFSEATGIFPPAMDAQRNPGQRVVTDWLITHILARDAIEGPAAGDANIGGTNAVINAVSRVLWAVKFATIDTHITSTQQTAVVTLFNTVWA